MSDTVINVQGLGKKYQISHGGGERESYNTLRDALPKAMHALMHPLKRARATSEDFWALKDVSFEIKRGECVGIIGRNGAGKSTLLKILSRITEPTTGRIEIHGRMASLLEVGTGFHPELTGRENIYLNGTILGMQRREIDRKFDEIVAFAEIEKFLDTPVKRYSSGMYVRLAFAVAAHLEPEILVVDEVLAVGDIQFQKKCLGKMNEVGRDGRTVLFVSHQMATIANLCSRVIVLKDGQIGVDGDTKMAIDHYQQGLETSVQCVVVKNIKRTGTGDLKIVDFSIEDADGHKRTAVSSGDDVVLVFGYEVLTKEDIKNVSVGFSIKDASGSSLAILYSEYSGQTFSSLPSKGKFKCKIRNFPFSIGRYFIAVRVVAGGIEIDWPRENVGRIEVEGGDFYGTGSLGFEGSVPFLIKGDWQQE